MILDAKNHASFLRLLSSIFSVVFVLFGQPVYGGAGGAPPAHQTSTALTHTSTTSCPAVNTQSQLSDVNHWYSPAQNNNDDHVINQCNSCEDALNSDHKACNVYKLMRTPRCAGASCADNQGMFAFYRDNGKNVALQHDLRHRNPERYSRAQGEGCRFILWALDPVIGVEDTHRRSQVNYWREAYVASQTLVEPPYPIASVGFVIQSALTRGQHQLHIHTGTLKSAYLNALDTLSANAMVTQHRNINGNDFLIRFVPNVVKHAPFLGIDLFQIASNMLPAGEQDMPRYGLLAALSQNNNGVYLMAAIGLDRAELNYSQSYMCSLR